MLNGIWDFMVFSGTENTIRSQKVPFDQVPLNPKLSQPVHLLKYHLIPENLNSVLARVPYISTKSQFSN